LIHTDTMTTPEAEAEATNNVDLSEEEVKKIRKDIGLSESMALGSVEIGTEEDVEASDCKGSFPVTKEELSVIRAQLACDFPDDYKYLSDAYITSVASKPYSKDPTMRRPLEYTMEKLKQVMEWRDQNGLSERMDLVRLANGSPKATEAVEQPEKLAAAKALALSLNIASMYWHGLTKDGNPVFWVRCNRRPWLPDVTSDLKALTLLADIGISRMPKGVTDFVVVSDSSSPPPPHPGFLIGLLKALVRGYPDRLKLLVSAPVHSIIQAVMNLLLPLMPGMLAPKIVLMSKEDVVPKLEGLLLNGKDDIPTFFGGPVDHDELYPEDYYSKNRGEGNLKFDVFGMIERLEKERDCYEASNPDVPDSS